jgi:hypothetical protein
MGAACSMWGKNKLCEYVYRTVIPKFKEKRPPARHTQAGRWLIQFRGKGALLARTYRVGEHFFHEIFQPNLYLIFQVTTSDECYTHLDLSGKANVAVPTVQRTPYVEARWMLHPHCPCFIHVCTSFTSIINTYYVAWLQSATGRNACWIKLRL